MASTDEGLKEDVEACGSVNAPLSHRAVETFAWRPVTVTVKDRATKQPLDILCGSNGFVRAGELLAIMGPSGCGKTTLLNVLAHRTAASGPSIKGDVLVDGQVMPWTSFRQISSYVEQDDSLIGSLTVRETLDFAARLALPGSVNIRERRDRVRDLLTSFGIEGQANTLIGTPIRKGISGGQKRRLSVASQLITGPKVLFLDEPTSGLDSAASFEVLNFVRKIARKENVQLIVIASVHQPSTSSFALFDQLLLLSSGSTCYYGPTGAAKSYYDAMGHRMPPQINPAEFLLDLVNVDFAVDKAEALQQLLGIHSTWRESTENSSLAAEIHRTTERQDAVVAPFETLPRSSKMLIPITLLHRSFIKSYRDVVAYGIRLIMYTGLAIMMGTVWLRLGTSQDDIQPFINAIFFGSAFMSFMAVAYVPAFLEDRATYVKERANGLYGPTSFVIANFLIGLPYLFLISFIFSCIAYWLSGFQPTPTAFFTWIMWLFLDLIAAESLVVLMSSLFPTFVIALALTAFANGLWMSVGGFLVPPSLLNVFWRYVFHYIDYQTYVFQGMMVNEFADRTYSCDANCNCMYQTALASECRIAGAGVLEAYGYSGGRTGEWVGILLGIVVGYRLLGWVVLWLRRS
ncbi:MAG: hypothetical protein M1838_001150 [Thelocarpon superellum]|nr:MAG: hypothetical protein M1838_001150 [Thelocarpon superellum]